MLGRFYVGEGRTPKEEEEENENFHTLCWLPSLFVLPRPRAVLSPSPPHWPVSSRHFSISSLETSIFSRFFLYPQFSFDPRNIHGTIYILARGRERDGGGREGKRGTDRQRFAVITAVSWREEAGRTVRGATTGVERGKERDRRGEKFLREKRIQR